MVFANVEINLLTKKTMIDNSLVRIIVISKIHSLFQVSNGFSGLKSGRISSDLTSDSSIPKKKNIGILLFIWLLRATILNPFSLLIFPTFFSLFFLASYAY